MTLRTLALFLWGLAVFGLQASGQTSTPGCTDTTACNYNAAATVSEGSCEFASCAG